MHWVLYRLLCSPLRFLHNFQMIFSYIRTSKRKNWKVPRKASTAPYPDVSMLSQPSEISDSRLRREVIYNIQKNEMKKSPARLPRPLIRMFQCSLSRRKSLISTYGVRLSITSKRTNWKNSPQGFHSRLSGYFNVLSAVGNPWFPLTAWGYYNMILLTDGGFLASNAI